MSDLFLPFLVNTVPLSVSIYRGQTCPMTTLPPPRATVFPSRQKFWRKEAEWSPHSLVFTITPVLLLLLVGVFSSPNGPPSGDDGPSRQIWHFFKCLFIAWFVLPQRYLFRVVVYSNILTSLKNGLYYQPPTQGGSKHINSFYLFIYFVFSCASLGLAFLSPSTVTVQWHLLHKKQSWARDNCLTLRQATKQQHMKSYVTHYR